MAYPQYYYPQQMQQQIPQPQQQAQLQQSMPQIANGFVSVRSEAEARNYPISLGNSITFKDENAPYVYTKTMGFSQLEIPRFEKYKLVKEEPVQVPENVPGVKDDNSPTKGDIEAIWNEIETIKKEVFKPSPQRRKKEVIEDDE